MLTIGSLFSGIGGLELGLEAAGLGPTLWQVERDEFCRSVLAKHWPDAERFDDVTTVSGADLAPVGLICGGFPCQDLSSSQRSRSRAGLSGSRSGLWRQFARILAETRTDWAVVENVESGGSLWVSSILRELGELGYDALPIPLSAEDVGAPHERARIFIVARHANAQAQPMAPLDAEVAGVSNASRPLPGWSERPGLRVADGIPGGLAAYGNAVVPQCAEVVGWVIRELMTAEAS